MTTVVLCTHCRLPQRGSAGLRLDGAFYPLCHPSTGMDCYRLVTVYHHQPMDCQRCLAGEAPLKAITVLEGLIWLASGEDASRWSRLLISPESLREMQDALLELHELADQRK